MGHKAMSVVNVKAAQSRLNPAAANKQAKRADCNHKDIEIAAHIALRNQTKQQPQAGNYQHEPIGPTQKGDDCRYRKN